MGPGTATSPARVDVAGACALLVASLAWASGSLAAKALDLPRSTTMASALQLLTARLPWEGTTLAELATRRENEAPLTPSTYDPAVPPGLSDVVLRALAAEPSERFTAAVR